MCCEFELLNSFSNDATNFQVWIMILKVHDYNICRVPGVLWNIFLVLKCRKYCPSTIKFCSWTIFWPLKKMWLVAQKGIKKYANSFNFLLYRANFLCIFLIVGSLNSQNLLAVTVMFSWIGIFWIFQFSLETIHLFNSILR